ncbi:hypothetical protein D3C75_934770 [compost metagenome]
MHQGNGFHRVGKFIPIGGSQPRIPQNAFRLLGIIGKFMVVLELLQRLQDIQVQHPVSVKIHQISLGNDRITGLEIVQLLGQLPDRFKIRGAKGGVHGGFDQR